MKTSIHYLNNASNEIAYTNSQGEVITRNPFQPEFVFIAQRLSLQMSNDNENQMRRNNYNRAVSDMQISVDNGKPHGVLPPVPLCLVTPDDFNLDETTTTIWTPPLNVLKLPPPSTKVDFGPDSAARIHTVQSESLSKAMAILATLGRPAIESFFEALLHLSDHMTEPPPAANLPTVVSANAELHDVDDLS